MALLYISACALWECVRRVGGDIFRKRVADNERAPIVSGLPLMSESSNCSRVFTPIQNSVAWKWVAAHMQSCLLCTKHVSYSVYFRNCRISMNPWAISTNLPQSARDAEALRFILNPVVPLKGVTKLYIFLNV